MRQAVITGASSGLGREIYKALLKDNWNVFNWSLNTDVDVRSWHSVHKAAAAFGPSKIDLLVNCAAINKINYLENIDEDEFDEVMITNVKSIFLCVQHLLPNLTSGGTVINIVSNAAHVPMTASLAYNASKGAALIATKQLARELLPRYGITVFSISPNKLKGTGMSKDIEQQVEKVRGWSPQYAAEYQKKALLTGEETEPEDLANFICYIMQRKENHKWFAGCDIPYGL